MASGLDAASGTPAGPPRAPSPHGSARLGPALLILAGILAVIGALSAGYYYAVRPIPLRIAVGPANSDDLRVVQALSQAFSTAHSQIRLRPIQTEGATASAQMIADGRADLAIVRGDLSVPKNAQTVATLRKNVAVLWVPAPMKDKKGAAKITKVSQLGGRRIGVIGRTPANIDLLKVILRQYGVDANKVDVVQFPITEAVDAIRGRKADAYLAAGPVNSKITSEAVAASTHDGKAPTFLKIDSAEAIAQNFPMYEASEIPAGA